MKPMDYFTDTENINPQIAAYLMALRSELSMLNMTQDKMQEAMIMVNQLEMQFEMPTPDKYVIKNLVSALPNAAMIASLGASLLSCL